MVPTIDIREAQETDLEAITAIGSEAFPYIREPNLFFRRRVREGRIFVAVNRDSIVGFVDITLSKIPIIEGLAVKREYRGKGIGKALLTFALNWLKDKGFSSVLVRTSRANTVAMHLYISMGFRPLREEHPGVLLLQRQL